VLPLRDISWELLYVKNKTRILQGHKRTIRIALLIVLSIYSINFKILNSHLYFYS
jgi:hypothetical protein